MHSTAQLGRLLGAVAITLLSIAGCGGDASVKGTNSTYSIGGTIAGLTASGLVLANGADTVSRPAGATGFVFAKALASGSSYTVMVKAQPSSQSCQVANGSGQVQNAPVTNVSVTCTAITYSIGGTIMGLTGSGLVLANGSDTVSPLAGATSFVFPKALATGSHYDITVKTQPSSQLCQVANASGQVAKAAVTSVTVACTRPWTWVGGAKKVDAKGVYGTQGVAAAGNVPGARDSAATWIDAAGDLWLFGGYGYDSTGAVGDLSDLWRYSPGSGQWTWIGGSNRVDADGAYGTQGTAAAGNVPGARIRSGTWIDSSGNLWLFGGYGYDSAGTIGRMNDLWRYSPGSGQWTWIGGASTANAAGQYSTQGSTGVPGGRAGATCWIDSAGDLWLFGGYGFDSAGTLDALNDLWRYSPGSGQWTWIGGSSTVDAKGVYGTQGISASGNTPGARRLALSWIDSAGDLWLFGGGGYDSSGASGDLNDLWRYSPGSGQWTWISGSSTAYAKGVYGTQGVSAPGSVPGARDGAVSWTDSGGDLWLFGGDGSDSTGISGELNDLWRYSPGSGQWTWISGAATANGPGLYGTPGTPGVPGGREATLSWVDSAGNLWLFGGEGYDSAGTLDDLNDLWRTP
jgi:N-acetylneuraminic acid mutarotase